MDKLKVHWVLPDYEAVANGFGYAQHNRMMRKFSEPYIEFDETAKIALHIICADKFTPIPGKKNILFCLAPETRVLTSNMKWVPIKDIKIGDELVGFDEKCGVHQKYRRTIVKGTSQFINKAYKIRTTEGDLIASPNHKWVIKRGKKGTRFWSTTEGLRIGDKIVKTFPIWEEDRSYEAGWLAGFLDGEGHVGNCGNGNTLGFAQNEGTTLDYACSIIKKLGFTYNKSKSHNSKYPNSKGYGVQIHQGLKLLGIIRPKRLLEKAKYLWEGQRTWSHRMQNEGEVLELIPIEKQELIGTLTTTGTLIAEGFLSHNTMWEFLDLPNSYLAAFDKADAIIVPSSFCKELFKPHTSRPVYTCWEGVDPEIYKFKKRIAPFPTNKFRFLWVGAPNPRKGYPFILEAVKVIEQTPNVEIYIKTTVPKRNIRGSLKAICKHWRDILFRTDGKGKQVRQAAGSMLRRLLMIRPYYEGELMTWGQHKNIFYDTRKLPLEDLVKLYESAHCFLLPTLGEGWGLTLCEAMATGCPSIATPVSGCLDFFDETVGYPIKYQIYEQDLTAQYNIKTRGYIPDTKNFIAQMIEVMMHYDKALKKGEKASERVRTKFTWANSGKRLAEILTEVAG